MDPASPDSEATLLQGAVASQGELLGGHDLILRSLVENNQTMLQQISQLTNQVAILSTHLAPPVSISQSVPSAPPLLSPFVRESYAPDPEPFSGDATKCRGFVLQCSLVFLQRPQTFPTDSAKIPYVIGLLRGRALAWAEAVNSHQYLTSLAFCKFFSELRDVFDHPDYWGDASRRLINIRQGARSVADYSVEFKTLAADAGWDDAALWGLFLNGLTEQLQDELATRDETGNFKGLVSRAIQLDNRLRGRRQQGTARLPPLNIPRSERFPHALRLVPPRPTVQAPSSEVSLGVEPMQMGRAHLSPAERSRRMRGEQGSASTAGNSAILSPPVPFGQKTGLASNCGGAGEPNGLCPIPPHAA